MDAPEAEEICDQLADLAGRGPSKDPAALVAARALLRRITQSSAATKYVLERANEVDTALSGWFDADERFHRVLKGYSGDIYALIDRLHSALREAVRFKPR